MLVLELSRLIDHQSSNLVDPFSELHHQCGCLNVVRMVVSPCAKEGKFVEVNSAFERRYGYSRKELLGRTVHELRIWEDASDRVHMITQLERGCPIRNITTRIRTKSGEVKLTAYSADKINFDGLPCILAVSEDVLQYEPHKAN